MNWTGIVEENKHDASMVSSIINLLLVEKKVRKSFLLEGMNFSPKTRRENILKIFRLIRTLGLKIIVENEKLCRFLVGREKVLIDFLGRFGSPKELGKVLGFYCTGHDFDNAMKNRLLTEIRMGKVQLIVEICELDLLLKNPKPFYSYYEDLLQKIGSVLVPLGFETPELVFTDLLPQNLRISALTRGDVDFIEDRMDNYIMDLDNYWAPASILAQKFPEIIRDERNKDLLVFIWKKFVRDDVTTKLPFSGEKINRLMGSFDEKLFRNGVPNVETVKREWNTLFGEYVEI